MSITSRRVLRAGLAVVALATTVLSSLTASPAAAAAADVVINEVESSGGTPGDWVELYNPGPGAADLSGYVFKDNDDTHTYTLPVGSTVAAGGYLVLNESAFGFGLGGAESARLFRPDATLFLSHSWATHATVTYGRCPNGTGAFATTTTSTKGSANDCSNPVKINEIESSGGSPGDWVELINPGGAAVNVGGMVLRDNDDTHTSTIASGTTIPAGGYLVVDEATLGFGLGGLDSVRLFDATGGLVDTYAWTAHAAVTYGRCPNGTGAFATTTTSTKGAANACTGDVVSLPWPGSQNVQTVDGTSVFGGNLSGLIYEGTGTTTPGVLWGARNGPGSLFRLVFDGTIWTPDTANGWGSGKSLRYGDGTGNVDAEGVTFAGAGSSGGIYVSTERNNDASSISRNSILRFDPASPGTALNATNEWNLTADLPVVGANLGMEAITWIPDAFLVSKGFLDESKAQAYNPAEYANHGSGLFFVGLEANGTIYAYALDHVGGGFTRIATIVSGQTGVMDLQFDRDTTDLWSVCDDTCLGRSTVLRINPATGKFAVTSLYDRPTGMANLNNEGFAIASATECASGQKPVFWADDSATGGHSIRRGTLPCIDGPTPVVPEFPFVALSSIMAMVILGGWFVTRRRNELAI